MLVPVVQVRDVKMLVFDRLMLVGMAVAEESREEPRSPLFMTMVPLTVPMPVRVDPRGMSMSMSMPFGTEDEIGEHHEGEGGDL